MRKTDIEGVYEYKKQLFTKNLQSCKGIKVYGENIIRYKNEEYRSWNPYRSKLAAAIINGLKIDFKDYYKVLYLGAGTGTTVSHISDIVRNGTIYAIEVSPLAIKKLLDVCRFRVNIMPILEDAAHPERYSKIVPKVDLIYQDISQRNQAEIFVSNIFSYLKNKGAGIIMVKARSIDVSANPKKVYSNVCSYLEDNGLSVKEVIDLSPFERDHAAIFVSF